MKSETMIAALHRLVPAAEYGRKSNPPKYTDIIWRDTRPLPTIAELQHEGDIYEEEEKVKKDKKDLIVAEDALLFDALLDLLPPEYNDRVAAYREAKE